MDFIQLGDTFIRIDSILRVIIENNVYHGARILIYTSEHTQGQSECVGGYPINSPEGQAFLGWLQSRTKRLLPSDILDKAKQA